MESNNLLLYHDFQTDRIRAAELLGWVYHQSIGLSLVENSLFRSQDLYMAHMSRHIRTRKPKRVNADVLRIRPLENEGLNTGSPIGEPNVLLRIGNSRGFLENSKKPLGYHLIDSIQICRCVRFHGHTSLNGWQGLKPEVFEISKAFTRNRSMTGTEDADTGANPPALRRSK